MAEAHAEEELLDYEEDEVEAGAEAKAADGQKKGYVGIHSTSFKDFLLKVCKRTQWVYYYHSFLVVAGGALQRVCRAHRDLGASCGAVGPVIVLNC